ncbi:MAG TPA: phosphoribosylformylglycinamidine cyclo-ligase, partial [Lachnospiraceae bacterium]|nr:phosphoribosylformylglycinamidine cyclo-ligase [Lachnospiraceae bacterium]
TGKIDEKIMYNTFNMGLGMMLVVAAEDEERTIEALKGAGETPVKAGYIDEGERGVSIC